MRPAFLLLPGMLLTLCACGRGGATLETDNVQAEWFPNGSRTAIVLDGETEPAPAREIQRANSGMTLLYNSLGDGRGTLGNQRGSSGNGNGDVPAGNITRRPAL